MVWTGACLKQADMQWCKLETHGDTKTGPSEISNLECPIEATRTMVADERSPDWALFDGDFRQ
jgi:hypothetical protein